MAERRINKSSGKTFDLVNTKDIPDQIKKQLIGKKEGYYIQGYILELFQEKEILSLDEILVGLYRKNGLIHDRKNLTSSMNELRKKREIVPGSAKGTYRLYKE